MPINESNKNTKQVLVIDTRRKPIKNIQYLFFRKPYMPIESLIKKVASVYGMRNVIKLGNKMASSVLLQMSFLLENGFIRTNIPIENKR